MSQEVVLIRIDNNVYGKVLRCMPNCEEVIEICKDYGYFYKNKADKNECIHVECQMIEIYNNFGLGSSKLKENERLIIFEDSFVTDDELLSLYELGLDDFIKGLEGKGFDVRVWQDEEFWVSYEDLL